VLAEYVSCFLDIPFDILTDLSKEFLPQEEIDGVIYSRTSLQNTHRDVVGHDMGYPKHGPSRFQPILPGLGFGLNEFRLADSALEEGESILRWKVHSDNAPPLEGTTKLSDIEINDQRSAQDAA
jgi:hypothetical protein